MVGYSLSYRIKEKFVSCSESLMLTLTWDFDILFEKLPTETGTWTWKTLFAHYVFVGGAYM